MDMSDAGSLSLQTSTVRLNSRVLAGFPWMTAAVMRQRSLAEEVPQDHYAFVSALSLIKILLIDFKSIWHDP